LRFPDNKPKLRFVIGMPTSFSCQRTFPDFLLSGSPLPAERSADLEPPLRLQIKNPASSAGHVRPLVLAAFYLRSLPIGYARSSFVWFPVFVTNLTSTCGRSRSVSGLPQRSEALPTSKHYTHFPVAVKLHSTNFHHRLAHATCAFLRLCGKFQLNRNPFFRTGAPSATLECGGLPPLFANRCARKANHSTKACLGRHTLSAHSVWMATEPKMLRDHSPRSPAAPFSNFAARTYFRLSGGTIPFILKYSTI
jgi:hypothetical protein